jgi:hypothetical protein
MLVQKTTTRSGRTLTHGVFEARETVHVCAAGCCWPSGAQVTRRAACLNEALIPGANVGYDVMVFVGRKRFLEYEQRAKICEALREKHGVLLSEGEVSHLAVRFTEYLARLHRARADDIKAALESDGGWPLHVDATGEAGRGTVLAVIAGWREWVLGSWKISTERADLILPCLRQVARILTRLGRYLEPVASLLPFRQVTLRLRRRAALFDKMRGVLRIVATLPENETAEDLDEMRTELDDFQASLQDCRPARGPAKDTREAIDIILAHIETHKESLFGHAIRLPESAGGGIRLVSRTNYLVSVSKVGFPEKRVTALRPPMAPPSEIEGLLPRWSARFYVQT